jgi:tetratricopeptide (TPR) repeat protein
VGPLERASALHEKGNTAIAVAQLRRLPPDHKQFAEAQALIAQWEASASDLEAELAAPSEDDLIHRDSLLAEARRMAANGDNLTAAELLDQARSIAPLEESDDALRQETLAQLATIENELDLFRQGDWDYALPNLWRLHEENPRNHDVVRLMVDCYYNLGVRDLQRGDPDSAAEKFDEALDLSPGDEPIQRLADFSELYRTRPADLQYRIFVKYHPFR